MTGGPIGSTCLPFSSARVVATQKGSVIQEMACWSAKGTDGADPRSPDRRQLLAPGAIFTPALSDGQQPSWWDSLSSRTSPQHQSPQSHHEIHRERQGHPARWLPLWHGRPGQWQRELRRQVHGRRLQPLRDGPPWWIRGAPAEGQHQAPGGHQQTEAGSQRTGEGSDPQRQHGLHSAAHPHSHRAGRPQAVQDRDAASGVQLHLAPG